MLSTTGLFSDMQKIAEEVQRDVENQLNQTFSTFEVIEDMTPKMQDENDTYYRMRIRTDDNGHVKVKTMRKDPGTDWKVEVEEYDRGNKPIESGSHVKSLGMQDSFFKDMQRMSNRIKRDVERQLNKAFKTFDAIENKMMIKTDDGLLKIKATQNEPTSELNVQVKDKTKSKEGIKGTQAGTIQSQSAQPKSLQTGSTQKSDSIQKDMQSMADRIQSLVEKELNQAFSTFEAIENRLKIKTDDNGQVKVKTTQGQPDVSIEVEDFKRGDMPTEANKEAGQKAMVH